MNNRSADIVAARKRRNSFINTSTCCFVKSTHVVGPIRLAPGLLSERCMPPARRIRLIVSHVPVPLRTDCSTFSTRNIQRGKQAFIISFIISLIRQVGSNKRKIQIKYKIQNKQTTMQKTEHANIPIKLNKLKKIY